jgi:hypothetical protein
MRSTRPAWHDATAHGRTERLRRVIANKDLLPPSVHQHVTHGVPGRARREWRSRPLRTALSAMPDLNLLGLQVHLDQVHLNITAQFCPGNLLGNLLCAVAHLLDGPTGLNAILTQIAALLNQLLGALGLTCRFRGHSRLTGVDHDERCSHLGR